MRLLVVSPYWTYPEVAIEFLTRIAERGHSVIAIKACNEPKSVVFHRVGNVIIYEIQNLSISAKVLGQKRYPYFINFNEILRKLDYDVMIVQLPLFLTSLQALRMGEKMKKPIILEVHGIYADRGFVLNLAQKAYLHAVGKWIFRKTSLIRCLTQQDARDLIRFGASPEKIRIIPNAVDTEKFKPSKVRRDDLIVWTGRFVPEKGVEYLIKAAKIVCENMRNCSFLLVGYGPLKQRILKLISKYGIEQFVSVIGPLPREKIVEILKNATIFAFPSLREGMPISVLEAMACGLPVIGTSVPGIKDIIMDGENGILVPPKNPEKLADAILTLLNNKALRQKLGRNARELVLKKYSWEVVLDKVMKAYCEVLEE